MAPIKGRDAAPKRNAAGPDGATDGRSAWLSAVAPDRPRVVDRWMGDLIRLASGFPRDGQSPAPPPRSPSLADPPTHLRARLEQAIRWGYQERELRQYEASLARRTTVGEFLSWARERQGRTIQEVGEQTGLPEEHLQSLEQGSLSPLDVAPEQMARLVHALDVSIWTVLERLEPPAQPDQGTLSASDRFLPHRSPPAMSPDDVWSAGARRRSSHSQPLALRDSSRPPAGATRLDEYRKALRQAWRATCAEPLEQPSTGDPEPATA